MSWQDQTLTMLRITIGDFDSQSFSDCRLEDLLLVAAQYVNQEIEFPTEYTISFTDKDITPDPTNAPDNAFINLTVLKAACLIDRGGARLAALKSGLSAKVGPLSMVTSGHLDGFKILIELGYCKAYEEAKKQYQFGNPSWIKGILSPFSNANFTASDDAPQSYNDDENRWRI